MTVRKNFRMVCVYSMKVRRTSVWFVCTVFRDGQYEGQNFRMVCVYSMKVRRTSVWFVCTVYDMKVYSMTGELPYGLCVHYEGQKNFRMVCVYSMMVRRTSVWFVCTV